MYDLSKLYEPKSIEETLAMMERHPEARILAGGSDLLIKMREGKLAGIECISIFKLDELRGVCLDDDGAIVIRPLTSFSHVAADPLVQQYIPVLAEAVDTVGGPQIRNIGTIGGNLCNGVTSADSASTLFALDAMLEITSLHGRRAVPIQEFYLGPGKVDLRPAELLTAIRIGPESYRGYFGKYIKYAMRNAMDIATLNCSVNVRLAEGNRIFEDVRIAYGVAAPTPMRCLAAEELIRGQEVSKQTVAAFAEAVLREIRPRTSWRASKELRVQLAKELSARALTQAVILAGGGL